VSNINKKLYSKVWSAAANFATMSPGMRWITYLLEKILKKADINSIKSVIDVGCGEGSRTFFLKTRIPDASVLGADFSEAGIEQARKTWCEGISGLEYTCVEAGDESLWENKYDLITCFEVLEHLDEWKPIVDKFIKSSNKYILLSFPAGRMWKYDAISGHVRSFKRGEMEDYLTQRGFSKIKTYYAGFPIFNPIMRCMVAFGYFLKGTKKEDGGGEMMAGIYGKPGLFTKLYSGVFYFLLKYFSTRHIFGNQFIGLFERIKKEPE